MGRVWQIGGTAGVSRYEVLCYRLADGERVSFGNGNVTVLIR
ncbi:MAG: hypothetical protein ACYSUD_07595 [Planctomycetota bacterium]|jgi:hypothetical protein